MEKKTFYRPTYPIFFRAVTGNKQLFFLGLRLFRSFSARNGASMHALFLKFVLIFISGPNFYTLDFTTYLSCPWFVRQIKMIRKIVFSKCANREENGDFFSSSSEKMVKGISKMHFVLGFRWLYIHFHFSSHVNVKSRFLGCHGYFLCHVFFCYQAPNSVSGQSGQFSLHLSHQGNRGLSLSMTYASGDRRTMWCHISTIPGTALHCLVNTEGNVNSLGTRSPV